jgi:hypothetical protein
MSISTASGSKLFIGGAGQPADQAAFEAESYVEVGEVEDLGQLGDESSEVTFASLSDGRMRKLKGVRDAGTMQVICGADSSDEGQTAMKAAEAQPLDYAFRVELNDQITLLGTPTIQYFYGKVMGKRRNIGTVNNVVRHNFNVGVNSAIVEIDPT